MTVVAPEGDAVVCEGLVKIYETANSRVQAVRGVDLRLPAAKAIAVIGPSGSGKSSLLRMISGLTTPTAGHVIIGGVDLSDLGTLQRRRARKRLVSHVEQHPPDNLLPHLTAVEQVRQVAVRRGGDPTRAERILDQLGLADRVHHHPHELSGGEQQRLAFARAAVADTALVVADEPTAELDAESAAHVLEVIDTLTANGTTTLVATHDPRVIEPIGTTVELRDGAVASFTDAKGRLAVIDASGRLQLPPAIREQFTDGRARLRWDDDEGFLRVERP